MTASNEQWKLFWTSIKHFWKDALPAQYPHDKICMRDSLKLGTGLDQHFSKPIAVGKVRTIVWE